MARNYIPLQTGANQNLTVSVNVDNQTLRLNLNIVWNDIGGYWFMTVTDASANVLLLDAIPLLPGAYPAANILDQYQYMGIGSVFVLPMSNTATFNEPTFTNFGTDYVLVWADTYPI